MKEFFGNIKLELKKITWPTDKEMKLNTIQVFVFMVVLSLFFAATDAVISAGVYAATRETPVVVETDYDTDFDYDYVTDTDTDDYQAIDNRLPVVTDDTEDSDE